MRPFLLLPKWKNRYSFNFDGVNETINIDSVINSLATTTKGTFSCWVRPTTALKVEIFIDFGDTNLNSTILLYKTIEGYLTCYHVINASSKWLVQTTNPQFINNTWTHIAVVQDGTSPVLYANAIAVAQSFVLFADKTTWFNSDPLIDEGRIGSENYNSGTGSFFSGNIDEVSFFNTNLSANQILELYNGGKPKNVLKHSASSNLVSYFRMGDGDTFGGTNWTIFDKKGTNNGTSANMESTDISSSVP